MLDSGFVDTYRHLHPEEQQYTYFGYRFNMRAKNKGWRIDYFVVSQALMASVVRTNGFGFCSHWGNSDSNSNWLNRKRPSSARPSSAATMCPSGSRSAMPDNCVASLQA